ncbi:MAG: PEP/pyruvate-binding domain-containing protein [Kiritimatiellia bacterium]|jgi:predicted nucleotidyltransferase|nr:PEP/pyruvate-binding domain-containing protein [Kiritimatiellia bacterium]
MSDKSQDKDRFNLLRERAKELNCLYQVEELLGNGTLPLAEIFRSLITVIPYGWQYPKLCQVRIVYEDAVYEPASYTPTRWSETVPIKEEERVVGLIEVSYVSEVPASREGFFLQKEIKLIRTIAERIGQTSFHRKLEKLRHDWDATQRALAEKSHHEWMVIVDLLRRTDEKLYLHISRKMLYCLFRCGIKDAGLLLNTFGTDFAAPQAEGAQDGNSPSLKQTRESLFGVSDRVFAIAARHLSDADILDNLHKWIQENKLSFLIKAVDSGNTPLGQIVDAILRYRALTGSEGTLARPMEQWLRVSLIRRFFTDNIAFINLAKRYLEVADFFDLAPRIIYPAGSNGRLGGKSTGLFLAYHLLKRAADQGEALFAELRIPKTWYLTADCQTEFLRYNELEDVNEQKYKELEQIRIEYPNIIQLFKNAPFPGDIVKGLSLALDDFGECPLIVRSSSLLEDRTGTAFSGKYKSLFLSNQGSKQARLEALLDAIAEIYASVYGPDPILYRAEHGLLDFHEEMGILIQEVVGMRVGPYVMPAYAGVAFSSNEFRWSPRLRREDGLVRLVPGLGTRAVDRVSNDYPVLLSPGQPGLRVNVSPDEIRHYAPAMTDVINVESRAFETVPYGRLLREWGNAIPNLRHYVSVYRDGHIQPPSGLDLDLERDELVATFEGLIARTDFVKRIRAILLALQEGLATPVDIEFASDGRSFYLLQCRPQYTEIETAPSVIPQDIPAPSILFTANRFISNGRVPDISHIVYVSPARYAEQTSRDALVEIARAVGRLNVLLPKRRFILMGPGRWGSRGDIKQGVQVTYADICNTAVLIEIAGKRGGYAPELSFGTHFFQDMVEAGIRYIPLYPDDPEVEFNERFLNSSRNMLAGILPEFAHLGEVLHVIDVPGCEAGNVLRILMNAELGEAVGYLAEPAVLSEEPQTKPRPAEGRVEDFWRWRLRMAEQLGQRLQAGRFGVQALYLFGSTANATAGPDSDIDLLVHFRGTPKQRKELLVWLEGWSLSLAEQNYLRTGYRTDGLLDVHLVTDEDIAARTSYAVKIGAVTDPAWPLALMGESPDPQL